MPSHTVGGAQPFQQLERQQRLRNQRAEADAHQYDVRAQPDLQPGDRRGGAAIAVADAGAHGVDGA